MMFDCECHGKNDRVVAKEIEIELAANLNLGVAVVAKVNVAQKVDRQNANRNLRGLDHAVDVDDRRESNAATPERLQLQKEIFIEAGIRRDLIVRASGDGIDRLAKRAQRALIRKRNRNDHADADR